MDHGSRAPVEEAAPTDDLADAPRRRPALSPSRADDFKRCPLLYRFRAIDRLPEVPGRSQVRGTLVHAVLEQLFDLPAAQRLPAAARAGVAPTWERLCSEASEFAALFSGADDPELQAWLASAGELLDAYFRLEDPRRLEPQARELLVETELDSGVLLRGYIDRVDVAATGEVRVVDYKGLALDTPLPTPEGWTTMGDVQVGDALIGANGAPCRVVGKSEIHRRPCYEIRFTDGSSVVADHVHLWSVHIPSRSDGRYIPRTISTEELHRVTTAPPPTRRGRRRPFIRATSAVDLPEVDLPIPPWILGAWLGDGATRGGAITIGHADREDMLRLLKEHWTGGLSVEPASELAGALTVHLDRPRPDLCPYGHDDFRDVHRRDRHHRRCPREREHREPARPWNACLSELLRCEGLIGARHVPLRFLRASRPQRLALLQGLMDTDGSWNSTRRRAVFATAVPELARVVQEVVHSLGGTSTRFEKPYRAQRGGRGAYTVEFRPNGFNPFSLPRKAVQVDAWFGGPGRARRGEVPGELRRTIAAVTPVDSTPTQCVMVDAPDSLYLCGDTFIPTHNTGVAPGEAAEARALFQMKFYALALLHLRGVVPRQLRLLYLADGQSLTYSPDEAELRRFERVLDAIWAAIRAAGVTGDFRPNPGRACEWCSHRARCPAWGGEPPPYPGWPTDGATVEEPPGPLAAVLEHAD